MFKNSVEVGLVAAGLLVALMLGVPGSVSACTCEILTPGEKAAEADAVFLGQIEFAGLPILTPENGFWMEQPVNFRVIDARKGVSGTHIGLKNDMLGTMCGAPAKVGREVLVYGYASDTGLYMGVCSDVKDPSTIQAELDQLEQLGYQSLGLTEGADGQWPPYGASACGLGVLPSFMMTMFGIACLRGLSPHRR